MRRIRWQVILLVVGVVLVLGVAICQFLPRSSQPAIESRPLDPTQNVYTEAIVGQPAAVNPLLATSQADRDLVALIYSGLTRLDDYGQPIPDLAQGWRVSKDGLTYTFDLRQDVTWHDGEPFTSADVDFTMRLLRDPDFPGSPELGAFWRTVETYALDDYTVRFVLTQPLAAFPEYAGIGLLPAHLLEGVDPASLAAGLSGLAPIGTGPLRLESLEERAGRFTARLIPYAGFYDPDRRVQLGAVELRFYPNRDDAFRALRQGDVMGMGNLSAAQLDAVLASDTLSVYTAPTPYYAAIIFNQAQPERLPFFQDSDVRAALAAGLDRARIVTDTLVRQAILADSPILPGLWAYDPTSRMPGYNPEAAAQRLDQAGWPLGEDGIRAQEGVWLAFELVVSDREADKALGRAIADQWKALGVDVSLKTVSADKLYEDYLEPRAFDAALIEFGQGGMADPDPYPFWHQSQIEGGQNYSGFDDRDVSEALEMARKEPNGVRRAELYRQFQQLFVARAAAIPLYYPAYHYAVDCRVAGVQMTLLAGPSDRFRSLPKWSLVEPSGADGQCGQ
jgi:peptide/nickel transport system substrate-binding protein